MLSWGCQCKNWHLQNYNLTAIIIMFGYFSLKYRCSSCKFHSLLWVEIDRNICKIQYYKLHLHVPFTVCHKKRVKPSSICKSTCRSIGSSIGEAGFLSLHHLYTILDFKKNWFPSTDLDTKRMMPKNSSHHSSGHPWTKKLHTKFD